MKKALPAKRQRLIDEYFPWGQEGFPSSPLDPGARERCVLEWLEQCTREFSSAALVLIARVLPVLREIESKMPAAEGPRLLARIDSSALVKTPTGILEKMARSWGPEESRPPVDFENFRESLPDLGRFRIVANFLSDVQEIAKALEAPYGRRSEPLSSAQKALGREYVLTKNRLDDSIHLLPGARKKGERCRKGLFHPRANELRHLVIELQIQTQLQEAWDKKDHFLVYEPTRRGQKVDPRHLREMFSMSELLYLADLTFDRMRQGILKRRRD